MWCYPRPNGMSVNAATLLVSSWANVIFMYQQQFLSRFWFPCHKNLCYYLNAHLCSGKISLAFATERPWICSSIQWLPVTFPCFFLSVGVVELGFQKLPPCVGRDQLLQKSCLSRADPPAKISKRESWAFILMSPHSFLHSPLWSHLCAGLCISNM